MSQPKPETETRGAVACTDLVRRWYRAALARFFPVAFARWVNSERCWIKVNNDPSGLWYVEIGCKHPPQDSRSLGVAMYRAFMVLESDPDWQWATDYLRSLHTPNAGDERLPANNPKI